MVKKEKQMKTTTQLKFDKLIKEGFHKILKPRGFKKKNRNFYKAVNDIGYVLNIQSSKYNTKDHIEFTINNGIFSPAYWNGQYNYQGKANPPDFPSEPNCALRKRIGDLTEGTDIWYEITPETDEVELILEMISGVKNHILPFFDAIDSQTALLQYLESEDVEQKLIGFVHVRFIMYAELNMPDKALKAYEHLIADNTKNKLYQDHLTRIAQRYKLI